MVKFTSISNGLFKEYSSFPSFSVQFESSKFSSARFCSTFELLNNSPAIETTKKTDSIVVINDLSAAMCDCCLFWMSNISFSSSERFVSYSVCVILWFKSKSSRRDFLSLARSNCLAKSFND
ncbi:MAG: hypothetical protein J6R22_03745 [Alphaproteobacteria bacterium]|nr:hypothetical protein [Alphaproteobacteria bacterium]